MRVILQSGHEGGWRNYGSTRIKVRSRGTSGEAIRNTQVVNAVLAKLSGAGIEVIREDGYFGVKRSGDLFIAVHHDGSGRPCASGASIGHDGSPGSVAAASRWRGQYAQLWPFKWMPTNFTGGLRGYYGYRHVIAPAKLVLELGELTCVEQREWLDANRGSTADVLAEFIRTFGEEDDEMFVVYGDRGPKVEYWQQRILLIDPGALPRFGPDGDFGDETAAALKVLVGGEGQSVGPLEANLVDKAFTLKFAPVPVPVRSKVYEVKGLE